MPFECRQAVQLKPPRFRAGQRRVEQDKIPGAKAFDAKILVSPRLHLSGEQIGTVVVARDAITGAAEAVDALAEIAVGLGPFIVHEIAGEEDRVWWPARSLRKRKHRLKAVASALAAESTVRLGEEMKIGELEDTLRLPLLAPSTRLRAGVGMLARTLFGCGDRLYQVELGHRE